MGIKEITRMTSVVHELRKFSRQRLYCIIVKVPRSYEQHCCLPLVACGNSPRRGWCVSVCRSRFENLVTCFSKFVSAVSCQARGAAREHKMYISPPTQKTVSCCNSSTVMYMDLILGVYSKALLQEVVRINASGKAPAWPTLL